MPAALKPRSGSTKVPSPGTKIPSPGKAPTLRHERTFKAQGIRYLAGVDEVGRGALCGPVVACVVILGEGFPSEGLDDSKRLTARQREGLSDRIREKAQAEKDCAMA